MEAKLSNQKPKSKIPKTQINKQKKNTERCVGGGSGGGKGNTYSERAVL